LYDDIADVPMEQIDRLIEELLQKFGTMDSEELKVAVCRQLGFQRLGSRIRKKIERRYAGLNRLGRVSEIGDGRVKLSD